MGGVAFTGVPQATSRERLNLQGFPADRQFALPHVPQSGFCDSYRFRTFLLP
jgi:hypothetical protein